MIPVCEPTLNGNELKYVTDAIQSGWISSSGLYIDKFEEEFAKYCGVKYAISCCNGTAALHLAIEALGIGPGDEVIIPTFTMIASCNSVIYSGAKPVLVDAELHTWNIDIAKIEEKITKKTKAIMVVHTYGHPVDMDKVNGIAKKYNLHVIEDAAEAHGAEYKGHKIGSLSDVACFSFYANKIMTTGEGGMVVTNNPDIAEKSRKLKSHFFGEPRFQHVAVGYNYRLTNIQAAVGLAQLEKLDEFVEMRRENAKIYNDNLSDIKGIIRPVEMPYCKNVYWMYGILIDENFSLTMPQLRKKLQEAGIETRSFFVGMHNQQCYLRDDDRFPDVNGHFHNSDKLEKCGLYLPSSSHLKREEILYICQAIRRFSL